MMVALGYIVYMNEPGVVACDSETNGIRSAVTWEKLALSTGVPEIAELPQDRWGRRDRLRAASAADAVMQCTQWITARASPIAIDAGGRIEEGARHRRYSSIEAFVLIHFRQNMAGNRLDTLKQLAAQDPANAFVRYGLAMEYANSGELEQAISEFHGIVAASPDYAAAYFHGGQTLEKLGRVEEAKALYEQGIAVTTRTGDLHTRSELQGALDLLP